MSAGLRHLAEELTGWASTGDWARHRALVGSYRTAANPRAILALLDERDALAAVHRDLVSRLGFGDNTTEPMADNDTVVAWFEEREREADEWCESQSWRNDCAAAGHPDDEDCWEHDPSLRLERAEKQRDALAARVAAVEAIVPTVYFEADGSVSEAAVPVRELRAVLDGSALGAAGDGDRA